MKKRLKGLLLTIAAVVATSATLALGGCSEGTTDEFFCDHKFELEEVIKETSCAEAGSQKVKCTECGVTEIQEIEKLPHKEIYVAMKPMTCTETGLTDGKKCTVCEEWTVAPAVIPAAGHKKVVDPAVAPTCMETGLTAGSHCGRCEIVLEEQLIVAATGHSPVAVSREEATCEEAGHEEGLWCSNCEQIYSGCEEIPALGHQSTGWNVQSYATADEYAVWVNTCGRCKEDYTKQMPKLTATATTEGLSYSLSSDRTYAICSITTNAPSYIVVADKYSGVPVKVVQGVGEFGDKLFTITIPSTVEEVSELGFADIILRWGADTSLTTIKNVCLWNDGYAWVSLPASVQILEGAMLSSRLTLSDTAKATIICESRVAPTLMDGKIIVGTVYSTSDGAPAKSYYEIDPADLLIFVPAESVQLYKNSWSKYADCIYAIEDMKTMGVYYYREYQTEHN